VLVEVVEEVVALVERLAAVGVRGVRNLVAAVLRFLVRPLVRDAATLAAGETWVVADARDAEFGEFLADLSTVRTALGPVEFQDARGCGRQPRKRQRTAG
jgi:hypothetical protein